MARPKNPDLAYIPRVELTAIEPIRIDGGDVAPGEAFDALQADADQLLACGAAVLAPQEPAKS